MMRRSRQRARGFTLIEVMTAVVVMTIGATGIVAMQGASVHANQDAQETGIGITFGTTWVERLKRDARLWIATGNASLRANTVYLKAGVPTVAGASAWFVPKLPDDHPLVTLESAAANAQGFDVFASGTGGEPETMFCTNVRMTVVHAYDPLTNAVDPMTAADTVRADVRVWWHRGSVDVNRTRKCFTGPLTATELLSSAIRKQHLSTVVRWRALGWP